MDEKITLINERNKEFGQTDESDTVTRLVLFPQTFIK